MGSAVLFIAITQIIARIKQCIYNSQTESKCINKTKGKMQQAIALDGTHFWNKKVVIIISQQVWPSTVWAMREMSSLAPWGGCNENLEICCTWGVNKNGEWG